MSALEAAGLTADEAFLVAVKRMGDLDALSREFAREYSERLWKQLGIAPGSAERGDGGGSEGVVVVGLAILAAVAVKIPELFGYELRGDGAGFYARNLSLFVLPLLTGYFAWKRRLAMVSRRWLVLAFAAAVVLANAFPFTPEGSTELLTALHLPIALWLAVGIAYAGGDWSNSGRRMDFVAISEFPKWRKYLISLSFRGQSSVRSVRVGGFDVNIVFHRSTAVRGRGGPARHHAWSPSLGAILLHTDWPCGS